MKRTKFILLLALFHVSLLSFSQKTITISGKIIEKENNLPLELATVSVTDAQTKKFVNAVFSNSKGDFSMTLPEGNYNISVEFISYKTVSINKIISENTNLGTLEISSDFEELEAVSIVAERPSVEMKLDKIIYNVGQDKLVAGGTATDVLDNVPSVTVDSDGTVSLRGNENVRVLINGKPSGMAGINISDALRMIPADAIEKIEVINNPSARYEAQGGAGIINIILKKGKGQGTNGVFTVNTGIPHNHGVAANINYKTKHYNLFTNSGYNYRQNPGNMLTNSTYSDSNGNITGFTREKSNNDRLKKGYNISFGADVYITPKTTLTNTFLYTQNNGDNPNLVTTNLYDQNDNFTHNRTRDNYEINKSKNIEFASNITHIFNDKGHQITADGSWNTNKEHSNIMITDIDNQPLGARMYEINDIDQTQERTILQADYVLPLPNEMQVEAGLRGDFLMLNTDFKAKFKNNPEDEYIDYVQKINVFEYKENVNAIYAQFGQKVGKFSYLTGIRWEDSNIDVNVFTKTQNLLNEKKYNNFFPSATINYELNEDSNVTLNYSKRVSRPYSRFINPFVTNSSDINRFQGNPDLDPSFTNALNLAYFTRWDKITLNSSIYLNVTNDAFQFVRRESGEFTTDGKAIVITSPINLSTDYRTGLDFTSNYTINKWWRANVNFNAFAVQTYGDYQYVDFQGNTIYQNFDKKAYSWFTRITSRIMLPGKIDWQTNGTYNAPQKTAQGVNKGVFAANLAFSKDLLNDKATLTLNVSDVFNSRKRIRETNLPTVQSYMEMQWRERQITLSFSYRFNRNKNEREKQQKRGGGEGGGEEFMG